MPSPLPAPRGRASSLLLLLLLLAAANPLDAQDDPRFRFGLSVGGISTLGLIFENLYEWGSFELTVGTWSFRDVSVSLVHKQYYSSGEIQGVVGAGLWTVFAFPRDGQTGVALLARVPVGVQWSAAQEHFINLEVGLNRALAIRRTDPTDSMPPNRRIIPLPGASYRWLNN